jgi:hypothetical protein
MPVPRQADLTFCGVYAREIKISFNREESKLADGTSAADVSC